MLHGRVTSWLRKIAPALVGAWMVLIGALPTVGAAPGTSDNADSPTAWLLDSPLRASLSPGGEMALMWKNGLLDAAHGSLASTGDLAEGGTSAAPCAHACDVRVNVPGEGEPAENCNTQSEVSVARYKDNVVAGWVDGGQCDFNVRPSGVSLSGFGYSRDGGETWTDGGVIQPAPGMGNVFGDPVVAADAKGTFYYASIADDTWGRSIIGVARSTDGGATWSIPVDASPGRAMDAFQDKPWLAVDMGHSPKKRNVYVAWLEVAPGPALGAPVGRILFSRSTNGAETFGQLTELSNTDQCLPRNGAQVAVGPKGEVYVVWIGRFLSLCFAKSLDGGLTFSDATEFVSLNGVGHDQVCMPGARQRKVLNGDIRVEEWPSLAVDRSSSPSRGTIYVAFASAGRILSGQEFDEADVFLVYSRDGGNTWSGVDDVLKPAHRLNDDDTLTDQFHAQAAVGPDGRVMVNWYDRRLSDDPFRENWEIDLFGAVSDDGGATFGPNFRVSDVSFPPSQTNPNSNGLGGCYMGEYNGVATDGPGEFLVAWGDNRDSDSAGVPDPNVYFDRIALGDSGVSE